MSEREKMVASLTEHAKVKGLRLNPDKKELEAVLDGLYKNLEEKGFSFCPCRARTGDMKEDAEIICPCAFHLKEVEEQGNCLCRLYFRK